MYVTNETGGDLTVIDGGTNEVVTTIALGKRPRGIKSESRRDAVVRRAQRLPIAGPGMDESKLPPPDKAADGIGMVDIAARKVMKILTVAPTRADCIERGRHQMFASNKDAGAASISTSPPTRSSRTSGGRGARGRHDQSERQVSHT